MSFFRWVGYGILFFVVVSFAVANIEVLGPEVTLRYYLGTHEEFMPPLPIWLLLFYSFIGGIVFSFIGAFKTSRKDRSELAKLRKRLAKLKINLDADKPAQQGNAAE